MWLSQHTTKPTHHLLHVQGDITIGLLSKFVPPEAPRHERYKQLKRDVMDLLARAGKGDKLGCAVSLVRATYDIVRLAHWCYPNKALSLLPLEQRFVSLCLSTNPKEPVVPESLGDLTPLLGLDVLVPKVVEDDAVSVPACSICFRITSCVCMYICSLPIAT